jgi:hypothetical protein
MNGHRPRAHARPSEIAWTALMAFLVAGLLAGSVAAMSRVGTLQFGPRVGDMLVFRPDHASGTDRSIEVARAAGGAGCVLAPKVMGKQGGSLVIEERLPASWTYRVHWAGGATSAGPQDCGGSANLLVPVEDLRFLAYAAGGIGVEHRLFMFGF